MPAFGGGKREGSVPKSPDDPVEVEFIDKAKTNFGEIAEIFHMRNITRLTLSHNKISAELVTLEVLTLWNNHIEELPTSISSLPKLRILSLGMNRLSSLPRGFGSFPCLEILDLTYNNLNEKVLPGNFFMMETLRGLYLGDNDFESLPAEVKNLKSLQILVLRDNDLVYLPKEVGEIVRLRELHLQGNRLTVLPPEIGNLDLIGPKQVVKLQDNPWVPPIQEQLQLGEANVLDYIRSETYKYLYGRHEATGNAAPPKRLEKSKKTSRNNAQPGC